MLGCFNPNLGQVWTNPNVGLKMSFKNLNPTVHFLITFLIQHLGFPYLTQIWVETTQHFCSALSFFKEVSSAHQGCIH